MSKETPDGPLLFIYGDDEFAVSQRARNVYRKWCEKEPVGGDNEIIEAHAVNTGEALKALVRLNESIKTFPFFGEGKIIWFKSCNYLGDDRTAKSSDVNSGLVGLASELKTFEWGKVKLIISSGKPDKRKAFYKALVKLADTEEFAAISLDDRDWQAKTEQFVAAKLKSLGLVIKYPVISKISQLVGPDTRALTSECEKLASFVFSSEDITTSDVELIVTQGKHAKAFALGDALAERDLPKTLKRLEEDMWAAKTDRKKSVIGLVAGLVNKMRSLLFARELLDLGLIQHVKGFAQFKSQIERLPAEIFGSDRRISPLGIHPYVLFNATSQAQNYTREELVGAMDLLMQSNHRLVSSSLDESFVLQRTLTQIVAREAKAA